MDGAFYFKFGFGREECGFESGSLLGGGRKWFFFKLRGFLGGGGGGGVVLLLLILLILRGLFFIKGIFLLFLFSVLWWRFINIFLTFIPSFTQFFLCTVGKCKC